MKISLKRLGFISHPLRSANCYWCGESVGMVVKCLFISDKSPKTKLGDRLNYSRVREIERDNFTSTNSELLSAAIQINKQSGRYELNAIPM